MSDPTLDIPDYSVELWDIHAHYVLDISRFVALDLNLLLNDADVIKFDIDLVQFTQLCQSVGLTPRNVLYPLKTQCIIRRNGVVLTGGRVGICATQKAEDGTKTLSVTVDGYEKFFATRYVSNVWTATDRSQIAWEAIQQAQSQPHGNLGVVRGIHEDTYASDLEADYMAVKDIIQKYTHVKPVTYDFEIAVDVVGGAITKTFNTYLVKGTSRPDIRLVDPRNISTFEVTRSADTMANSIIGIGGAGDSQIIDVEDDADSQIEYLVKEDKELFSTVSDPATLADDTAGVLAERKAILVTFSCVAEPGTIDPGIVKVGDSLFCRVENDPYNDDIVGMYRIYSMHIEVDRERKETVTPSFYNPDMGGEIAG